MEQDDFFIMKLISTRPLTQGAHLNLFEISYLDVNNHQRSWRIASRHSAPKCMRGNFEMPDAVVIVAHHVKANKLVIIKEFRVPLGNYQYGFPAGLVDEGESIEQTAVRELYEETGLTLQRVMHISPPIYSSSGLTDESISMVYVTCEGEPSNQSNMSSEEIQTVLVSSQEAREYCCRKDLLMDVKTWLVLSEYARTGSVYGNFESDAARFFP